MNSLLILLLVYLACRFIKPLWLAFLLGLIVFGTSKFFILASKGYTVNILNVIAEFLGYFVMAFVIYFISNKLKELDSTKNKNTVHISKDDSTYIGNTKLDKPPTPKQKELQQQYDKGEITFEVYQSEWNKSGI